MKEYLAVFFFFTNSLAATSFVPRWTVASKPMAIINAIAKMLERMKFPRDRTSSAALLPAYLNIGSKRKVHPSGLRLTRRCDVGSSG
jgi:hypothetical protein